MVIRDVRSLLPSHPETKYARRPSAAIDALIVHHEGAGLPVAADEDAAIRRVTAAARYHVERRGWPGIGYHYVVVSGDLVLKVGAMNDVRYHAAGWNTRSIGVMLLGDFERVTPPPGMVEALRELVRDLRRVIPGLKILAAHREVNPTTCPGLAVEAVAKLRGELGMAAPQSSDAKPVSGRKSCRVES